MDTSIDEALAGARQLWGGGCEPTADNLRAAAVGLASQWYRNTEAVEQYAHAAGPWDDPDMMRNNARATALCLAALTEVACTPEEALGIFDDLIEDLAAMLPTKVAGARLLEEKGGAPGPADTWIKTNGLGSWLAFLVGGPFYPCTGGALQRSSGSLIGTANSIRGHRIRSHSAIGC